MLLLSSSWPNPPNLPREIRASKTWGTHEFELVSKMQHSRRNKSHKANKLVGGTRLQRREVALMIGVRIRITVIVTRALQTPCRPHVRLPSLGLPKRREERGSHEAREITLLFLTTYHISAELMPGTSTPARIYMRLGIGEGINTHSNGALYSFTAA